ncbi:HK97 family phage prohead protease [Alkaliphilus sp. B6464]|uniref:HK97 family phage prohead protease n=1 Tax=Alkaliphilus sp. B6464 TaxID=2731219 RepID=UPI001BAAB6D6|nr:HK97 family phage prohead protease [Alkaliphilus sp. B6464]QUH21084.1 HK97 family phage prohead protease [Alkaliphilus sp. B6464]
MRIEVRNDKVILDGYVNAVDRDSKPIITAKGKCVERIEPRAFDKALGRAENVDLLLNHRKDRKLGSIKEGNLELFEDNIGLRAIATVTDPETIQKAKEKKLRGWSFGMFANKDRIEERSNDIPRRHIEDLNLFEVSIIDDRMSPCYIATSIEQRAGEEVITEQRGDEFRAVIIDESSKKPIDYSEFENKIKELRGDE